MPRRQCPVCRTVDIQTTSASPGDGRRKYTCRVCAHSWTNGKRPGEGYRSFRYSLGPYLTETITRKLRHNGLRSVSMDKLLGGQKAILLDKGTFKLAEDWWEWAVAVDAEARLSECICSDSLTYHSCPAYYVHHPGLV